MKIDLKDYEIDTILNWYVNYCLLGGDPQEYEFKIWEKLYKISIDPPKCQWGQ